MFVGSLVHCYLDLVHALAKLEKVVGGKGAAIQVEISVGQLQFAASAGKKKKPAFLSLKSPPPDEPSPYFGALKTVARRFCTA